MVKMPGVTRAAFFLGYINIISLFVALANERDWVSERECLLIILFFLFIAMIANAGEKWARIIWTTCIGIGILLSSFFIHNAESMVLVRVICGIVLPIVQVILLWHPATTAWFKRSWFERY